MAPTPPERRPQDFLHHVNHPDRHEAARHRPPAEGGDPPPGADEPWVEGDGEDPAEGPP